MAYTLRTFGDLVNAVREELKIQASDTSSISRIKRDINIVYKELLAEHKWWWLNGSVDVQLQAYVNSGSAHVTQNSSTVTLSIAPVTSKKDQKFSIDGFNEVYNIQSHTAGTNTIILDGLFNGATNSEASYRIWTDRVPLPTDCKETTSVYQDYNGQPLETSGQQEFRRITSCGPKTEGRPTFYFTGDFKDPSDTTQASIPSTTSRSSAGIIKTLIFSGSLPGTVVVGSKLKVTRAGDASYTGEIFVGTLSTTTLANDTITYTGRGDLDESTTTDTGITVQLVGQEKFNTRYRELFIHPSMSNSRVTLHVDYIKEAQDLEADSDEPAVPLDDRVVLLYGALARSWQRERNPESAQSNYALYANKLAKMAGKLQDTFDKPIMQVSRNYLNAKRGGRRGSMSQNESAFSESIGSGGGGGVPTGSANTAAVFNSQGNLDSSPVTRTELNALQGVTSNVQAQINAINVSGLTAITGDVSASGSGSVPSTVNTVGGVPASTIATAAADVNTATPVDTASTIVRRDSSGNFSASTITANLSGNATGFTGSLAGDVTGTQGATHVASVGGSSAANIHAAELAANAASSANQNNIIVKRDSSGAFSASTITANLVGTATNFGGALAGDVTGTQSDTVVSFVGTSSAANIHSAELLANAATSTDAINTLVKRDGSGNFDAGVITARLNGVANNISDDLLRSQLTTGTPHRALINGANGDIADSIVTDTELSYVSGARSSLQDQIDSAPIGTGITRITGDVVADGPGVVPGTVAFVGGSSAANVNAAELLANAATSSNTPSTIVKRDASGNFTATTVTANLTGNASGSAATITGSLTGDVTSSGMATTVALVAGSTAANVHAAELAANAATASNTSSTIVKRDGSGNFTASTITADLVGNVTGHASLDEPAITAGTSSQYWRGDKTFQTLDTSNVPENTNLYYTEARVSANTDVAANTADRHVAVTLGTASGLSLAGQTLSMDVADATHTGTVTTGTQTFSGAKTFTNPVIVGAPTVQTGGALNIQTQGDGVFQGLNINSVSNAANMGMVQRDNGDFFMFNGSVVFQATGIQRGTGPYGALSEWDVNGDNSNTNILTPLAGGFATTSVWNNFNSPGNLSTWSAINASAVVDGAMIVVHDSHAAGASTGHFSFVTRDSGTIAERARIDATGIVGNLTGNVTGDVTGNTSGTASNVTGTVAIANGGTGQTGANAAFNALAPSQTGNANKFLKTDGTNTSWVTPTTSAVLAVVTKTSSYTATGVDDVILCDASGGAFTVTIPLSASNAGKRLSVKKIDTSPNRVTLARTGSDLLDAETTQTYTAPFTSVDWIADGSTNWYAF